MWPGGAFDGWSNDQVLEFGLRKVGFDKTKATYEPGDSISLSSVYTFAPRGLRDRTHLHENSSNESTD